MVKLALAIDVSDLSDDDLFKKLKELGVDVGPIVGSTRKIYERKLQGLLTDSPRASESGSEEECDDKVNDHEEYESNEDAYQSEIYSRSHDYNSPDLSSFRPYLENLRRPVLTHTTSPSTLSFHNKDNISSSRLETSSKSQGNHDQNQQSPSSIGLFVKLAIVVAVIAFLIFIVCQNMESDRINPIPNV